MKTIDFGAPRSDATYLITGFSGCRRGRRYIGQVARMKLFLPPGEANRLTLQFWYDREQTVDLRLNRERIGTANVKGTGQVEAFEIDVPAALAQPESVLEFRCERAHPLDAHQPRCCELDSMQIAAWDEPEPAAQQEPDYSLYFGDVHVHSDLSPCRRGQSGSLDENYEWAKADGWDFAAIADHDTFMTDEMWRESLAACERHNDPGKFATIFAYEWTSFFFGQMNVYSPSPAVPLCRCTDFAHDSPPKLWAALKGSGVPAFTVYHHMAAPGWLTTWDYNDPDMLPLIEVHSVWRSSVNAHGYSSKSRKKQAGSTAEDALARGFRVGFIGGGDAHLDRPGQKGIAGVRATECTREAIWDALKAKRCYATTAQRIELDFTINRVGMGQQITFTPYTQDIVFPARCQVRCKGTAPIRHIEVIENGEVLYVQDENFGLHEVELDFPIENLVRAYNASALSNPSRYYYVRVVQQDGNMAWSSPIYLVRDWSGVE